MKLNSLDTQQQMAAGQHPAQEIGAVRMPDVFEQLGTLGRELCKLEDQLDTLGKRLGPLLHDLCSIELNKVPSDQPSPRTGLGHDIDVNTRRVRTLNIGVTALLENLGI